MLCPRRCYFAPADREARPENPSQRIRPVQRPRDHEWVFSVWLVVPASLFSRAYSSSPSKRSNSVDTCPDGNRCTPPFLPRVPPCRHVSRRINIFGGFESLSRDRVCRPSPVPYLDVRYKVTDVWLAPHWPDILGIRRPEVTLQHVSDAANISSRPSARKQQQQWPGIKYGSMRATCRINFNRGPIWLH